MKRAPAPSQPTRRHVLKASLWGAVGASLSAPAAALAEPLFDLDARGLRDLAIKVTGALPFALCQGSLSTLAQQIGPLTSQSGSDVEAMLQLLHADDIACERTWEVQGLHFSRTQIGLLTSFVREPGAVA